MTGIIPGVENQHFWHQLAKPIVGLSPMDGVTDHEFRFIQKKYGQPSVVYTEFTSVEGVCHGAERLLTDFMYDESQRPIIGQIYGTTPDFFRQTTILLCELGFDGIDINMGCPAKNVAHSGAGAALIQQPKLAQEIVLATKQGITDWHNGATATDCPDITPDIASHVKDRHDLLPSVAQSRDRSIPISVKTRIGYSQEVISDWIPNLLAVEPAAISVHGRTLKQQYGGLANWEAIGKAAELASQTQTLILGNGDVTSLADAQTKAETFKLAGTLIGRAAMGNPYVFKAKEYTRPASTFEIAVEHAQLYEATYKNHEKYNFLPMRKHLGWYVRDVHNASQIRIELFQTNTSQEVAEVLQRHGLV